MLLFSSVQELAEDWAKALEQTVDWSVLGCDKTAGDSTVWLGTEGSHTPLHYDTYGVNLVRFGGFSSSDVVRLTGAYHQDSPLAFFYIWAAHALAGSKALVCLIWNKWGGRGIFCV